MGKIEGGSYPIEGWRRAVEGGNRAVGDLAARWKEALAQIGDSDLDGAGFFLDLPSRIDRDEEKLLEETVGKFLESWVEGAWKLWEVFPEADNYFWQKDLDGGRKLIVAAGGDESGTGGLMWRVQVFDAEKKPVIWRTFWQEEKGAALEPIYLERNFRGIEEGGEEWSVKVSQTGAGVEAEASWWLPDADGEIAVAGKLKRRGDELEYYFQDNRGGRVEARYGFDGKGWRSLSVGIKEREGGWSNLKVLRGNDERQSWVFAARGEAEGQVIESVMYGLEEGMSGITVDDCTGFLCDGESDCLGRGRLTQTARVRVEGADASGITGGPVCYVSGEVGGKEFDAKGELGICKISFQGKMIDGWVVRFPFADADLLVLFDELWHLTAITQVEREAVEGVGYKGFSIN